jgi:hypothetical protein
VLTRACYELLSLKNRHFIGKLRASVSATENTNMRLRLNGGEASKRLYILRSQCSKFITGSSKSPRRAASTKGRASVCRESPVSNAPMKTPASNSAYSSLVDGIFPAFRYASFQHL